VGTIGLFLARNAKRVIGVESVKAAVLDANRNATINGIVNAEYVCGKAEEVLPELVGQGVQADVVILDPPRAGCDPALLAAVAEAGPRRIVYVSCDPATLARDIKILTQYGYRFVEAQPVDMFPQTAHVECVVLMCASSEAGRC
jgi:23S rRNA (uracil1939-C5)-methyltransferase